MLASESERPGHGGLRPEYGDNSDPGIAGHFILVLAASPRLMAWSSLLSYQRDTISKQFNGCVGQSGRGIERFEGQSRH